jgi:hypothetical protein
MRGDEGAQWGRSGAGRGGAHGARRGATAAGGQAGGSREESGITRASSSALQRCCRLSCGCCCCVLHGCPLRLCTTSGGLSCVLGGPSDSGHLAFRHLRLHLSPALLQYLLWSVRSVAQSESRRATGGSGRRSSSHPRLRAHGVIHSCSWVPRGLLLLHEVRNVLRHRHCERREVG